MDNSIIYLVIGLATSVALFMIFRHVVLWYLKIDRKIELLEKNCNQNVLIIEELRLLNEALTGKEPDIPEEPKQEAA